MKKMNAALSLAMVALLSLVLRGTAVGQMPPDNVQGDWTIYSTNIENGETVVKHVQIAQYGNRITGYFEGPNQSGPIQGRVDVHHIMFSTVTRNVLIFRGQIYGDNMSGLYGLHGKHAAWQAERPAAAVVAAPPATETSYQSQPVLAPPAPAPAPAPFPQPAAQPATAFAAADNSAPAPAPLPPDQLDALVAPIALYPDALVAQVLAAAENPDQVDEANNWLGQNTNLTGAALAQAVDQQSWDPSVKALTQFPSVLNNLAQNLSWTSSLGQVFANQQADVMEAVQVMRAKAQAAGTLQSTSQITVTQPSSNTIVIQPANPQVVYIPQYNPTVVYGAQVVVPFYVPPPVPVAAVGLYFGTGITIGATIGGGGWGGGFGWGWHAWNVNWGCCGGGGSTTIIYNHNTYINNHTWNNTNYNGNHPWRPGDPGYRPGTDTHYGPNGDYHPGGYYGPNGAFHHDVPGTNPSSQPNGGNNGNHGLIGGNGGAQHSDPHADSSSGGDRGPNGGNNGNHGMIGGNGGVQHSDARADGGSSGDRSPNGGNNGNKGMIGGNGGVQHSAATSPNNNRSDLNYGQNRSRMSGNGAANRAESNRGRGSMAARRPQMRAPRQHAPVAHRSGGGGGRRR